MPKIDHFKTVGAAFVGTPPRGHDEPEKWIELRTQLNQVCMDLFCEYRIIQSDESLAFDDISAIKIKEILAENLCPAISVHYPANLVVKLQSKLDISQIVVSM